MKDLAREARQVRCSGTEKSEAWEGYQGRALLKAMVRTVVSAAAVRMDQGRATDHYPDQAEGGLQGAKHKRTYVWAEALVLARLDAPFCRDVTGEEIQRVQS